MTPSKTPNPTEAELQILQVLWEHGPSSVRFVNEIINEEKEVGYTTTLKIMQIMSDKGLVQRDTSNRSHIYLAHIAKDNTLNKLIDNFVNNAFQGSAKMLVMQALGNEKVNSNELEEIKKFIASIENK